MRHLFLQKSTRFLVLFLFYSNSNISVVTATTPSGSDTAARGVSSDMSYILPFMNPEMHMYFAKRFDNGWNSVRPLIAAFLLRGIQSMTSSIWEAYVVSHLYPSFKRWTQKTSMPEAIHQATQEEKKGATIEQLILNNQSYIKIHSYILTLKRALKEARDLPSLLLYGPSGTGKTQIAARLIEEGDFIVYQISGGALQNLLPREFEHLFRWLDKPHSKPVILIIDEAEQILQSKISGMRSSHLKIFLTGMRSSRHFLIVGTTNFGEDIDTAAFRRFQTVAKIGLPEKEQRIQLIEYYLNYSINGSEVIYENDFMRDEEALNRLAEESQGLAGSHIKNLCENAIGEAILFNGKVITSNLIIKHIQNLKKEMEELTTKKKSSEEKKRNNAVYQYYESKNEKATTLSQMPDFS